MDSLKESKYKKSKMKELADDTLKSVGECKDYRVELVGLLCKDEEVPKALVDQPWLNQHIELKMKEDCNRNKSTHHNMFKEVHIGGDSRLGSQIQTIAFAQK